MRTADRATYTFTNWLYLNPRYALALIIALILVAGQMDGRIP